MAVRKPHIHTPGFYFITFTNKKWLPLIDLTDGYDLVYHWFDHLRQEGQHIVGFVTMPNHIHLVLAYDHGSKSLNTLVGTGKKFMARGILERLRRTEQATVLQQLEQSKVTDGGKKSYKVFKNSFDVQHCYSQKFILQKLQYIHNNPCAKKWMLAADTQAYPHSSAAFYETGQAVAYPLRSWLELADRNRVP